MKYTFVINTHCNSISDKLILRHFLLYWFNLVQGYLRIRKWHQMYGCPPRRGFAGPELHHLSCRCEDTQCKVFQVIPCTLQDDIGNESLIWRLPRGRVSAKNHVYVQMMSTHLRIMYRISLSLYVHTWLYNPDKYIIFRRPVEKTLL